MLCAVINEQGLVEASPTSIEECTSYVLVSSSEYNSYMSSIDLNPADAQAAFEFGFGVVFLCFMGGYAISLVRAMIRQV